MDFTAAAPNAPKSTFPNDRFIALLIRTESRNPEAPSSAPAMMRTLFPMANPVAEAESELGLTALVLLLAAMACSPAKAVLGWTWPVRVRRPHLRP